jgi:hypothetical protein
MYLKNLVEETHDHSLKNMITVLEQGQDFFAASVLLTLQMVSFKKVY